jgi:hypothetical protein
MTKAQAQAVADLFDMQHIYSVLDAAGIKYSAAGPGQAAQNTADATAQTKKTDENTQDVDKY